MTASAHKQGFAIAAVAVLLLCAVQLVTGETGVVLHALPFLLLLVPLLLERYVGEATLDRLRSQRRRGDIPRRPAIVPAPRLRTMVVRFRGALLLAASLAVRPPPRPLSD